MTSCDHHLWGDAKSHCYRGGSCCNESFEDHLCKKMFLFWAWLEHDCTFKHVFRCSFTGTVFQTHSFNLLGLLENVALSAQNAKDDGLQSCFGRKVIEHKLTKCWVVQSCFFIAVCCLAVYIPSEPPSCLGGVFWTRIWSGFSSLTTIWLFPLWIFWRWP